MTTIPMIATLGLAGLLATADDAKVTVHGVHLCCNSCVKAIDEATAELDLTTVSCDRDQGTVTIVAPDLKATQAALDAISDAGYHGTPDCDEVSIKDDSDTPEGKVQSLTLSGAHNCCQGCSSAISDALEEVDGVEQVEAEPGSGTIDLSGDFIARAAVDALAEAGFHVKVKKD